MDLSLALADIVARRRNGLGRPILVGLAGPQGSGKSTLAGALHARLQETGLAALVLSLDDFYLPRAERLALAERVHPLLTTRGPPGTHDLPLLEAAVTGLLDGRPRDLPSFDKALDDRRPAWVSVGKPADIILFEGWCVGAAPQGAANLVAPVNALEREADPEGVWRRFVNDALAAYQPLFRRLDLLIQLRPPGFEVVADWRWEQEAKLRAERGQDPALKIMSEGEVRRFVQHYERIARHMQAEMPARADVVVSLARDRSVQTLAAS